MDLHERPVSADDKVRLAVFVDESGRGLEPLELSVFGLESIGDQSGRARLEHCANQRNGQIKTKDEG